jgi:rhodanese-related sulfurtransferase
VRQHHAHRETQPSLTAAGLLAVALVCGTIANVVSPARIAWVHDWSTHIETQAVERGIRIVDTAGAQAIVSAGTTLVFDARPTDAFDAGHLPGAMSMPAEAPGEVFGVLAPALTPDTAIMVYCTGRDCDESLSLATYLQTRGFTNLYLYVGGYDAWTTERAETAGGMP